MLKNVASQKLIVYAFDATTGVPKTGDAANLTAYVSKDFGAVTVLGDTSATEMDATNAKGSYLFDLTQGETNADCAHFTAKSTTANIYIAPQTIYTDPPNYTTLSVDGSGRAKGDVDTIKTQAVTCAAGVTVLASVGTAATSTAQTGDNFARLGAPAGASVSADIAAAKVDTAAIKVQTDKMTFTVANVMDANMLRINGDATSAANIAKTTRAIGRGTATTAGSSTTLIATSAFLPVGVAANADQFAGRVITFDADTTTTKLRGQSTSITSSSAAAAPVFTVVAITIAPVDGDTFSVT